MTDGILGRLCNSGRVDREMVAYVASGTKLCLSCQKEGIICKRTTRQTKYAAQALPVTHSVQIYVSKST